MESFTLNFWEFLFYLWVVFFTSTFACGGLLFLIFKKQNNHEMKKPFTTPHPGAPTSRPSYAPFPAKGNSNYKNKPVFKTDEALYREELDKNSDDRQKKHDNLFS